MSISENKIIHVSSHVLSIRRIDKADAQQGVVNIDIGSS